jgi:hypothetical protein
LGAEVRAAVTVPGAEPRLEWTTEGALERLLEKAYRERGVNARIVSRVREATSEEAQQAPLSSTFSFTSHHNQDEPPTNENVLVDRLGMHFVEQPDSTTPFVLGNLDFQPTHSIPNSTSLGEPSASRMQHSQHHLQNTEPANTAVNNTWHLE